MPAYMDPNTGQTVGQGDPLVTPNQQYDSTKTYWTGRQWITPGGQETLAPGAAMERGPVGEYGNLKNPYTLSASDPNSAYYTPPATPQPPATPTSASPQFDQNQFMQQFLSSLMGIGRFGGYGGMGGYSGGYGGMGGYGGYGGYPMGGYGGYPMGGMYRPQGPQPRGGIGRLARPSGPLPSGPTMMKEAGAATYGVPPSYDTTPSGGMTRGGFFFRRGGRV